MNCVRRSTSFSEYGKRDNKIWFQRKCHLQRAYMFQVWRQSTPFYAICLPIKVKFFVQTGHIWWSFLQSILICPFFFPISRPPSLKYQIHGTCFVLKRIRISMRLASFRGQHKVLRQSSHLRHTGQAHKTFAPTKKSSNNFPNRHELNRVNSIFNNSSSWTCGVRMAWPFEANNKESCLLFSSSTSFKASHSPSMPSCPLARDSGDGSYWLMISRHFSLVTEANWKVKKKWIRRWWKTVCKKNINSFVKYNRGINCSTVVIGVHQSR